MAETRPQVPVHHERCTPSPAEDPAMPAYRRPPDSLPDVFIGSRAVDAGLLTARQLRGPYVARLIQGVYRPVWVPLTHQLKCQAACLVLPDTVVVTGPSAATVLGLRLASPDDDVTVALPMGMTVPHRQGVRLRRVSEQHPAGAVLNGVRLAHARRLAFDAAVRKPLAQATAVLDALVRHGLVDIDDLRPWLGTCQDNNVRAVRCAAELVDPRAESLPESITRVHLVKAGFAVVPQHRVVIGSRVVARVDLALPDLKIAIEYDGRWHEADVQRALDNDRLARLRAGGWTVIVVTAELLRDPRRLVATVSAAVAERSALGT
jgi:very-short-patch-repair endonuclease